MTPRHLSYHLAPVLVLLTALAAAGNWYLRPDRATAWAIGMLTLPVLWVVASLLLRTQRRRAGKDLPDNAAHERRSQGIRLGMTVAGTIMLTSLGAQGLGTLGVTSDPDLSRRSTMIVMGALLMFMGNAMPKMLTPLSVLQCDGSRTQAFQRLAGWTWVGVGLGWCLAWIALPVHLARPVSVAMMVAGTGPVVVQGIRLWRSKGRTAPPAQA